MKNKLILGSVLLICLLSSCGLETNLHNENVQIENIQRPLEEKNEDCLIAETSSMHPEANAIEIRFDGLYCHIFDEDSDGLIDNRVLRFYDDGTVIAASIEQSESNGGYFPHASWFDRNKDNYKDYLGYYSFNDGKITLTTISQNGTVDYQGSIDEKYMILDSHSNINGHESENVQYEFYSFSEIPRWYD